MVYITICSSSFNKSYTTVFKMRHPNFNLTLYRSVAIFLVIKQRRQTPILTGPQTFSHREIPQSNDSIFNSDSVLSGHQQLSAVVLTQDITSLDSFTTISKLRGKNSILCLVDLVDFSPTLYFSNAYSVFHSSTKLPNLTEGIASDSTHSHRGLLDSMASCWFPKTTFERDLKCCIIRYDSYFEQCFFLVFLKEHVLNFNI